MLLRESIAFFLYRWPRNIVSTIYVSVIIYSKGKKSTAWRRVTCEYVVSGLYWIHVCMYGWVICHLGCNYSLFAELSHSSIKSLHALYNELKKIKKPSHTIGYMILVCFYIAFGCYWLVDWIRNLDVKAVYIEPTDFNFFFDVELGNLLLELLCLIWWYPI